MPPVDRPLVAGKLRAVKNQVPSFKKGGAEVSDKTDFTNWRHEVMRWLRAGEVFTDREALRFANIRFKPLEWDYARDVNEFFHDALGQADHTLGQAIENLELGIRTVAKPSPTSTPSVPLVVNSNTNVLNLNLVSVVETLAAEIEKQDPIEGKRFREMIKRWAQNPKVWDLLIKGSDLILRGIGR